MFNDESGNGFKYSLILLVKSVGDNYLYVSFKDGTEIAFKMFELNSDGTLKSTLLDKRKKSADDQTFFVDDTIYYLSDTNAHTKIVMNPDY